MKSDKPIFVSFASIALESVFTALKKGRQEEIQMFNSINRSIQMLKENPSYGIKITKVLWPVEFQKKYCLTNLWKYNLSSGWRMIYTIKSNDAILLVVILGWFDHKQYEHIFKY